MRPCNASEALAYHYLQKEYKKPGQHDQQSYLDFRRTEHDDKYAEHAESRDQEVPETGRLPPELMYTHADDVKPCYVDEPPQRVSPPLKAQAPPS